MLNLSGKRFGRSGPLRIVLERDGYGTADEADPGFFNLVEVTGADENDVEWFKNEWDYCGIDLLGHDFENHHRLVVTGRMWFSRFFTPDCGEESDGGFDVEEILEEEK